MSESTPTDAAKQQSAVKFFYEKEKTFTENQLLIAKSPVGIFELPCGILTLDNKLFTDVEVHEIDGAVEDMLASSNIPGYEKMNRLLAHCIKRIGPATDKGTLNQLPYEMAVGDRVFLIFAIRRVSVGDGYPFLVKCPNETCGKEDLHLINLADLPIKAMEDRMTRVFEETLPRSGKVVKWHVLTGQDEARMAKLTEKERDASRVTRRFWAHFDLLEGKPPRIEDVKAVGSYDLQYLNERFDDIEGGVDTGLDLTCKFCRQDFEREVDIQQSGFFFPGAALKAWKKKSST